MALKDIDILGGNLHYGICYLCFVPVQMRCSPSSSSLSWSSSSSQGCGACFASLDHPSINTTRVGAHSRSEYNGGRRPWCYCYTAGETMLACFSNGDLRANAPYRTSVYYYVCVRSESINNRTMLFALLLPWTKKAAADQSRRHNQLLAIIYAPGRIMQRPLDKLMPIKPLINGNLFKKDGIQFRESHILYPSTCFCCCSSNQIQYAGFFTGSRGKPSYAIMYVYSRMKVKAGPLHVVGMVVAPRRLGPRKTQCWLRSEMRRTPVAAAAGRTR